MARLTVLGGTGYAGSNIVATAAERGHTVVAYSRTAPSTPVPGVEYRSGDVADSAVLAEALQDTDAVISALSPRGALAEPGTLRAVLAELARLAAADGVRLGVIGGAGSLHVAENGPRLYETEGFPEAFRPEAREMGGVLDDLRAGDERLDWFFVSPAGGFGGFAPGEATGSYRIGGEVLLADENGQSYISGADLALAVIREIEEPEHRRTRFTVAY